MQRFGGIALLVVLLIGVGAVHVHAQLGGTPVPITFEIDPSYPGPYDTVKLTPDSTQFDISGASTVLFVNGTQVGTGTGSAPFSIPMEGPGVPINIKLQATFGSQTYSTSLTLHPEQVSIVLEPDSATHPFYEGMPALASEGRARVVVLANFKAGDGSSINPNSLMYDWKMGDQELQAQSGIGQSVLTLTGPIKYRPVTISVIVTTQDSAYVGQSAVILTPGNASVVLYRDDPLLGPLYNAALGDSYTMAGQEDTYVAVPYAFSAAPSLVWQVNGQDSGSDPFITVRATGSGSGMADISVQATGPASFDTGSAATAVSFSSGSGSTGTFGL